MLFFLRSMFFFCVSEMARPSCLPGGIAGTEAGHFQQTWKHHLVLILFLDSCTLHLMVNSQRSTLLCMQGVKILKGTEGLVHTLPSHISKLWASSRDSITLQRVIHIILQRGPVCIYLCRQARTVHDPALDTLNKLFHHSQSAASNSIHCLSINFSGLITSNHVWLRHVSKLKVQQQGMRWIRIQLAHGLPLAGT